jgi:hypothetical protein
MKSMIENISKVIKFFENHKYWRCIRNYEKHDTPANDLLNTMVTSNLHYLWI